MIHILISNRNSRRRRYLTQVVHRSSKLRLRERERYRVGDYRFVARRCNRTDRLQLSRRGRSSLENAAKYCERNRTGGPQLQLDESTERNLLFGGYGFLYG